jgi:hypothetical protein
MVKGYKPQQWPKQKNNPKENRKNRKLEVGFSPPFGNKYQKRIERPGYMNQYPPGGGYDRGYAGGYEV